MSENSQRKFNVNESYKLAKRKSFIDMISQILKSNGVLWFNSTKEITFDIKINNIDNVDEMWYQVLSTVDDDTMREFLSTCSSKSCHSSTFKESNDSFIALPKNGLM